MAGSSAGGNGASRKAFTACAGRAISSDEHALWLSRLLAVARLGALVSISEGPPLVIQDPQTPFDSDSSV